MLYLRFHIKIEEGIDEWQLAVYNLEFNMAIGFEDPPPSSSSWEQGKLEHSDKRPILYWLRSLGGLLPKMLWKSLTSGLNRAIGSAGRSVSQQECAIWLYRSCVTYRPEFSSPDGWTAEELRDRLPIIDPCLDKSIPTLKALGMTGSEFLNQTSTSLGEGPLYLTFLEKKLVFNRINKMAKDNIKGGGGIPRPFQFSNLMSNLMVVGDTCIQTVHKPLLAYLNELPPIVHSLVYKAVPLRYRGRHRPFAIWDRFPLGGLFSWPHVTSGTTDLAVVQDIFSERYLASRHNKVCGIPVVLMSVIFITYDIQLCVSPHNQNRFSW